MLYHSIRRRAGATTSLATHVFLAQWRRTVVASFRHASHISAVGTRKAGTQSLSPRR